MKYLPTRAKVLLVGLFLIIATGVVIPKVLIKSSLYTAKQTEVELLGYLNQHRDNPIQRALTMNITVDQKIDDVYYVSVYTIFGFKLEKIEVIINKSAKTTFCNPLCE